MASRPRPPLSQLGLKRFTYFVLSFLALEIALSAVLYPAVGLSFVWQTNVPVVLVALWPFGFWIYFLIEPGRSAQDWAVAERFFLLGLFSIIFLVQPQAQYVALAFKRPLIDHWLAAADAALGVNVVALTAWTARHPFIRNVLFWSYATLVAQFGLPLVALWFGKRDREALWEYTFNFFVCSFAIILILGVFPAACPMTYYGFKPLVGQARVEQQIAGIRAGTLTRIDFGQLDGVISFPSFHTAGALMVTWAFRHKRWLWWPLLAVNTALIAATVMLGVHYFVDIVAGAALFGASVWLYRRTGPKLLN